MPSITIRDVPKEVRDELAARAALTGRSLQEYLRAELIEMASQPDPAVVLERAREQTERFDMHLSREKILAYRDADRP